MDYVGEFQAYKVYRVGPEGKYKDETENIYLKYNSKTGYYDMWQRGQKCGHCTRGLKVVDYKNPVVEVKTSITSSALGTDDFFKRVEKEIEEVLRSEVKCG